MKTPKKTRNLIVIGTPAKQPMIGQISDAKKSVFTITGDNKKSPGRNWKATRKLSSNVVANQGYIEEVVSPWNPHLHVFRREKSQTPSSWY